MKTSPRRKQPPETASLAPAQLSSNDLYIDRFQTDIGAISLVGSGQTLTAVYLGHPLNAVKEAARAVGSVALRENWHPAARRLFEDYAAGDDVDFSEVKLQLPPLTAFQQKIIAVTRQIPYGHTSSYGELARRAGYPRAARAVGTVMKSNRFPIVIPCHRVLAAGGKIGGYSAPAGLDLKQRLLEMECRRSGRSTRFG